MAAKWTKRQELLKRKQLDTLYGTENKSIGEIAVILKIGQSTVYERLLRLGIKPARYRKIGFNNKRNDISIPEEYVEYIAKLIHRIFGIEPKTARVGDGYHVVYFGSLDIF